MKTVKDMFDYTHKNSLVLLSSYDADFWSEYLLWHDKYDALFARLYKTFSYFNQEEGETISEVYSNFKDDVYNHLLLHDKQYSELYKIHVLSDDAYGIVDNYSMKEIMDKDTTDNGSLTSGARTDTFSGTVGSQTSTSINKVSPYDRNDFSNETGQDVTSGARNDTSSNSIGSQTDLHNNTGTENYTLTKNGNIGVSYATDMLGKHDRFWSAWNFYAKIFNDICTELLLV